MGQIDGKLPRREDNKEKVTYQYLPELEFSALLFQRSSSFCPESPWNHPSGSDSLSGLPALDHSCFWSIKTHSLTCLSFNAAWTEGLFSICWASLLFLALASCCCCCIEARIFTGIGCLFFSILVKLQGRTKWMFK